MIWNEAKENPDYSKDEAEKILGYCLSVTKFRKLKVRVAWYLKKLELLRNNEKWTG